MLKCQTQDNPIQSFIAPHWSDSDARLQEKAKRSAWQKVVDDGVKPEDAQKRYVNLVNSMKQKHGFTG